MDLIARVRAHTMAAGIVFLIVTTILLYAPMFDAAFKSMDDMFLIVHNQDIREISQVPDLLRQPLFKEKVYYRPLVSLSYMLEYQVFGLNPLPFHLSNIFIHVATALLVWRIVFMILADLKLSYAVSLLFAIHPIQWEAVSNISGRAILLCAFFVLLSFCFYIRSPRNKWSYFFSLISFGLALMAKESAVVLPLVLAGYQFLIKETKPSAFRSWLPVVPYFIVLGMYMILRVYMGIVEVFYWESVREAVLAFVTFLRSVITYGRLFVFPVGLVYDRSMPILSGGMDGQLWATFLFYGISAGLLFRCRKKIPKVIMFSVCWVWLFLIPVAQVFFSLIVRPGYILMAEHFVYLSSVGVFILMALGVQRLDIFCQRKGLISQKGFWIFIVGMFVFFGLMTLQQNLYSSNEVALYEASLKRNPWNQRLRHVLTSVYYKAAKFSLSEGHLRQLLIHDPQDKRARINLGRVLCEQGRYQEGIEEYKKITAPGYFGRVLNWHIAAAYEGCGQWGPAAKYYEKMLIPALVDDENMIAARRLAEIYDRLGEKEKAARYRWLFESNIR